MKNEKELKEFIEIAKSIKKIDVQNKKLLVNDLKLSKEELEEKYKNNLNKTLYLYLSVLDKTY
ncbi:MAG: hypothetical protein N2505_00530 [Endomicrobia bacterium]|nr:hypothetical protein [Endomicrobiia bacterium]